MGMGGGGCTTLPPSQTPPSQGREQRARDELISSGTRGGEALSPHRTRGEGGGGAFRSPSAVWGSPHPSPAAPDPAQRLRCARPGAVR